MSTDLVPFVVEVEGSPWSLWRQSADSKVPLAKDLDVARWLGYSDLHKVRELIARHSETLGEVSATMAETTERGGRPGRAFYLSREQALFIAAKSDTPNATAVLKTMIAVFLKAHDVLAGYEQQIADLRRQLSARSAPPSLRPTDIAAAWARAHLEQGKEPMLLRDAWARYVEWSQEQGLPMPLHLSTLSYGLAALFHQSKTRGAVAYYCQLRAQPLPVDLPQRAQQSLPLPAPSNDMLLVKVAELCGKVDMLLQHRARQHARREATRPTRDEAETMARIVEIVQASGRTSASAIRAQLGMRCKTVYRLVRQLVDAGVLERVGTPRPLQLREAN